MVLAHGTNCPFLHIIHIFLFQPASTNLRAYLSLKPMSVYRKSLLVCFLGAT